MAKRQKKPVTMDIPYVKRKPDEQRISQNIGAMQAKGYQLVHRMEEARKTTLTFVPNEGVQAAEKPLQKVQPQKKKQRYSPTTGIVFILFVMVACCFLAYAVGSDEDSPSAQQPVSRVEATTRPPANQVLEPMQQTTTRQAAVTSKPPTPDVSLVGVVTISAGSFQLHITRIWETTEASDNVPDRAIFLIFEMQVHNGTSKEECIHDRDFPADVNGSSFDPSSMRQVRDEFYPGVDYPGSFNGQCIEANTTVDSLLVYDIPADPTSIAIEFDSPDSEAAFTLSLARQENSEYEYRLTAIRTGQAIVSTYTVTPTPSITPTASVTPTATNEPESLYVISDGRDVNVRSGAGANYPIVGRVPYGSEILIIGIGEADDGSIWYEIIYGNSSAWIHSGLTSPTRPPTLQPTAIPPTATQVPTLAPPTATRELQPTRQPVVQPTQRPPAQPQPPQSGSTCGGASTCGEMSSCEQAYACLRAGNSRLDQDNDGVPCESICPGG